MPPILKKLVDISVWILFVVGCVALILGIVALVLTRVVPAPHVLTPHVPAPNVPVPHVLAPRISSTPLWSLGVFSLFLSVVAAWFRKIIG
jgi:membrane protein implicated in regulation of membrane protease activity